MPLSAVTGSSYGAPVKKRPMQLTVGRNILQATAAFDSYWRLAAERQRIFFRRLRNEPPPWTDDPILGAHRFTNAYRASDRVSQFLINQVIYGRPANERSLVLRVLLFKVFNRIETWEHLETEAGPILDDNFEVARLGGILDARLASGERLYSPAYIMPSPKLGSPRKHVNHLRLLETMLVDGTIDRLIEASSLKEVYSILVGVHSFGSFLAFQFAIDLNYSTLYGFSEMDFVVAGPGARDGIAKCFFNAGAANPEDIIHAVTESSEAILADISLPFESLWGRPLQLIDCQNLFCEVDKYSRVAHPELRGFSRRSQIKRRYIPSTEPLNVAYPPRWGLPFIAGMASINRAIRS